jgi:DNA-directed RNA polymerase specialized sigma subunit
MTARAYHARKSKNYFVNRNRHYEFDTFNSDLQDLKSLSMGSFKAAAKRFDKQFESAAVKFEAYIVKRINKKYIVELEHA